MPDLKALSTGTKIVLGAGLLLLITTFFAWQEVSAEFQGVTVAEASANAWHGFWGVVMGLMLIALLVLVGLQIARADLVADLPDKMIVLVLAVLILVFAVVKNLTDDFSAWGSVLGIILAAVLAIGAYMSFQEPEAATSAAPAAQASPPPEATPPPPAPAAEAPPPAAPETPEPPSQPETS